MGGATAWMAWAQTPVAQSSVGIAAGNTAFVLCMAATATVLAGLPGQRGTARLLAWGALFFLVEESVHVVPAPWSAVCLGAGPLVPAFVGGAFLSYPRTTADAPARLFVWVNLMLGGLLGLGLGVSASGLWAAATQARPGIEALRVAWWALGALVFVALLARRWSRAGRLERSIVRPVFVVAAGGAVIVASTVARPAEPSALRSAMLMAHSWVAVAIAAAFLASALALWRARARACDLARELPVGPCVADVQDALRRYLGDDRVLIQTWLPLRQAYVDARPRESPTPVAASGGDEAPGEGVHIPVQLADGEPLARIVLPPDLAHQELLVAGFLDVSRLALENAHLEERVRAERARTAAIRSALLRSAMEQRRQLERDLHDGAQQHLLALSIRFALAHQGASDPESAALWARAGDDVAQALEQLRELAHGLYPAVMADLGLAAALRTAAERLGVVADLDVAEGPWPAEVCTAAYFTACEAMTNAAKHAGGAPLAVCVRHVGDEVRVEVRDAGPGSPALAEARSLPGLRERLVALGGQLEVASGPGGTCVTGRIPCG